MNKNILSNILTFAAGAAVGSVVTWKLVKEKYEQIATEEIRAVREIYEAAHSDREEENEDDEEVDRSEDRKAYANIVKQSNYHNFRPALDDSDYYGDPEWTDPDEESEEDDEDDNEEEEDDNVSGPYIIPPSEFDENGYETVTLYHYADGVVANAYSNEVIKNPGDIIGDDFADHYGEYEPDSVYVRNDELQTDFEILRDNQSFSEVR